MAIFFYKNQFVNFPRNQVNEGDIGTIYLEVQEGSEEMDRYNYAKSQGLPPKPEWVFDNNWNVYDEFELTTVRERVSGLLEEKYTEVVNNGFTFNGNAFLLDVGTKTNISDWNQFFEKENKIISENPNYTRLVTTASISDKNNVQIQIPLSNWDSFFLQFGALYAQKYSTYKAKYNYIHSATSSLQIANYNTDI